MSKEDTYPVEFLDVANEVADRVEAELSDPKMAAKCLRYAAKLVKNDKAAGKSEVDNKVLEYMNKCVTADCKLLAVELEIDGRTASSSLRRLAKEGKLIQLPSKTHFSLPHTP